LIQSDFITNASRESVIDCAWNDAIGKGVAEAFAKAITAFATPDHPLRYSWLDYLPPKHMEGIWKKLYSSIVLLLEDMPVLQTWERKQFKCPYQLRQLPAHFLHEEAPLFRDLPDEVYLAPEYDLKHRSVLQELGTVTIKWGYVHARILADLVKVDSYIKTRPPDETWHEAFACLLLRRFQNGGRACLDIKKMSIIPLNNGNSWTGAPGFNPGGVKEIYFPDTEGIAIPNDISLHLVEKRAASNASRKELFEQMGVENCPKETVLSQIEATQKSPITSSMLFKEHSRYLFYYHPAPELLTPWFHVPVGAKLVRIRPSISLFFPSKLEYDTEQLLPRKYLASNNSVAALIDKKFADLISPIVRPRNLSWKKWLGRATGAQYHPSLVKKTVTGTSTTSVLSPVILAVLQQCPEKFVGLLRAHWAEYKSDVSRVRIQLMDCKVPCESGTPLPLDTTYLPTIEIKDRLRDLQAESGFPLLKLPSALDEANEHEWHFLEKIGVSCNMDNRFDEIVLRQMMESDAATKKCVVKVYKSMAQRSTLQDKTELKWVGTNVSYTNLLTNTRLFFDSCTSIAVENSHNVLWWIFPSKCVWNGPDFLTVKVPLQQQYGEVEHMQNFFSIWLDVPNVELEDILDELDHRRTIDNTGGPSITEVANIYRYLESTVQTSADWKLVRYVCFIGRNYC
jgi:hypothetical protein